MAETGPKYEQIIDKIANILPETREKAKAQMKAFGEYLEKNKQAFIEYRIAQMCGPLFIKLLKASKPGRDLAKMLKPRITDFKMYTSNDAYANMVQLLDDRHNFNKAVTKAKVKLHARKLKDNKDITPEQWHNIWEQLKLSGFPKDLLNKVEPLWKNTNNTPSPKTPVDIPPPPPR